MPRNFSKYQYETSPRKLEPEYTPVKNPYKKKKTTARKVQTTNKNKVNEIKKRKMKVIKYIAIGFLIIFGISLRNSQIDENFAKIQDLKSELAEVEKQNAQLEVAIENGMNLNNLEQEAKTQLERYTKKEELKAIPNLRSYAIVVIKDKIEVEEL